MLKVKRLLFIIFLILSCLEIAEAQITGTIVDKDGYAIPYASAMYKGHHIAAVSDIEGKFTIERHAGWILTVSCVGFHSQNIKVDDNINNLKIVLKDDSHSLNEVVVNSRRNSKYSRKNNPAVELMKRVIAAKKETDLTRHPYYEYDKYQKITLAFNDIKDEDLDKGIYKKQKWLLDYLETSPFNGKRILPVSVDETVSRHIYRKDPKSEKDIIMGQKNDGLNNVLQTGEILNTMLKDVFTDVDIYDDHVRLFQYPFESPIGNDAVSFYRFYIEDTVYVDKDLCYHLQFIPNNQQDFGFRGELYVLADSTLHVKKCELTIPQKSDVNFVKNMRITQEYTKLSDGEWVLTTDDMGAELHINNMMSELLVVRTTRLHDYNFTELPKKLFRGKAPVRHEADARVRDDAFWNEHRTVELSKTESSMNAFIHRMEQSKNYQWIIFGVKAFLENYIETGSLKTKSKFDFGPVNTLVSSNFVDGLRYRVSGRTTANLNPHWFWDGYYAYGSKTNKSYYSSEVTYSLNKKQNVPFEFPQRNIVFENSYDVMSPSDKFLLHNKDNIFMTFKWESPQQMYFYNRQKLSYVYESDWGFSSNASIKLESNEPTGDLEFRRMAGSSKYGESPLVKKIRTTEFQAGLKYCPGLTFVNTKQRRLPVNLDAPEFTVSHTMGVKGMFGGDYKLNFTEATIYKRTWLGSYGYIDAHLEAGAEWNMVPFPLLIMPPTNLTYMEEENSFYLMRNMEFLSDRYAYWGVSWDMNGKLLNRIPLIRKLKWREYVAFKGMFSNLTDKNNPYLGQNANDETLFQFPEGSRVMDKHKPYMEIEAGVHNVFKCLAIDFVHRLNYCGVPGIKKNGIRFSFMLSF